MNLKFGLIVSDEYLARYFMEFFETNVFKVRSEDEKMRGLIDFSNQVRKILD